MRYWPFLHICFDTFLPPPPSKLDPNENLQNDKKSKLYIPSAEHKKHCF